MPEEFIEQILCLMLYLQCVPWSPLWCWLKHWHWFSFQGVSLVRRTRALLHSCKIFARLSSVGKVEELKCSQQYSACRTDFFSPSLICNPKLQQGCQEACSLQASFSKPEAAALGHLLSFQVWCKEPVGPETLLPTEAPAWGRGGLESRCCLLGIYAGRRLPKLGSWSRRALGTPRRFRAGQAVRESGWSYLTPSGSP